MASAQDVGWERIGDGRNVTARVTFADDGYLYAFACEVLGPNNCSSRVISRLPPPYGPTTPWEVVGPDPSGEGNLLFALGPDTLLADGGGQWFFFSTDNGRTLDGRLGPSFAGLDGIAEIEVGPYAGTIVTISHSSTTPSSVAAYTRDRGQTWTLAPNPLAGETFQVFASDIATVRAGPHAGRVLVGCAIWGVVTSDDGGATYQISSFWIPFGLEANAITRLSEAAPGGGDRLVVLASTAQGHLRTYVSDDGGDSFRFTSRLPDIDFQDSRRPRILDLGGGRALAVSNWGHLFETTDAGETWTRRDTVVPYSVRTGSQRNPVMQFAILDPTGRLVVGGTRFGPQAEAPRGWAWRTTAPYAVASAAGPSPASPGVAVAVRPNPASSSASVVVTAGAPVEAVVVVVDARGREVARLHAGAVSAGATSFGVDTSGWASGVYAVRVTAGAVTATARLVVAR